MPWRELAVEVTPERIKVFWGGRELGSYDPAAALDEASRGLANRAVWPGGRPAEWVAPDADLTLGKGLGLYVTNGAAAFQSVAIEPLPGK